MPLYRIERNLGRVSPEEIDAAAFRSISCLTAFAGMAWIRSFYDAQAGQMTCYYVAANPDDLRKHAEVARIPCDTVAEVIEYLPDAYR